MAEDKASIDGSTVLDNAADRQVEFSAEVGGDWYDFALRYSAIEALNGASINPADDVVALFGQVRAQIEAAAAKAVARGPGTQDPIVVAEGDLL